MSSELHQILQAARTRGQDPDVAVFLASADEDVVRASWLLSVALEKSAEDLGAALAMIWPDIDDPMAAVEEALSWPFAVEGADGWLMNDALAASFAISFREREPETFRRCHQLLANLEEQREATDDLFETWFVRGRVAFYLAGFDEQRSLQVFGDAFARPPSVDRVGCRMWLSTLVLRQEELLGAEERGVIFFRGFRAYVSGDRRSAQGDFERVVENPRPDVLQAIASHLLGVLLRPVHLGRCIDQLQQSIRLSQELGLTENEVMARNSLSYALLAEARELIGEAQGRLDEALSLARANLQLAHETGDRSLIIWCEYSDALFDWLRLTDNRRTTERVDPEITEAIVGRFIDVRDRAWSAGDVETALLAGNQAAHTRVDTSKFAAAVDLVEELLARLSVRYAPAAPLKRLAQTTGSMVQVAEPALHGRLYTLLDVLNSRITRAEALEARPNQITTEIAATV